MIRKKSKLGFTLIEVLVVVAIIAGLVAIAYPVVQTEIIKSAAAANAANLRNVVGKLATMKAGNTDDFEGQYKTSAKNAANWITNALDPILTPLGWENFANWSAERLYASTAENGTLYWSGIGRKVMLTGVPGAKAMSFKDANGSAMIIDADAPMTVFITDTAITASYYTRTGVKITIGDFADIAQDGEYNGSASEGTVEGDKDFSDKTEDFFETITCRNHVANPNAPCICQTCKNPMSITNPHSGNVGKYHTCPICQITLNASCQDGGEVFGFAYGQDCYCDFADCDKLVSHVGASGTSHTCSKCGDKITDCDVVDHGKCYCSVCKKEGTHTAQSGTHKCANCTQDASECPVANKTAHSCSICTETSSHTGDAGGCASGKVCTICGENY